MAPLDYVVLRLVRRHLPKRVMHGLLRNRLGVRPGLETSAPAAAVDALEAELRRAGRRPHAWRGARVLVFGFGGYFGSAVEILRRGARHVVLLDPYAEPYTEANARLAEVAAAEGSPWLRLEAGRAVPDPAWITVVPGTIAEYRAAGGEPADLVVSNSVFEHVDAPDEAIAQLARVTAPGGSQLHFIDLRDHYFKHPFEMLCWSETAWRRVLNPPSNLNRWRAWQYESAFRRHFDVVRWEPLRVLEEELRRARPRIRPEFLSGDDRLDAVGGMAVYSEGVRDA